MTKLFFSILSPVRFSQNNFHSMKKKPGALRGWEEEKDTLGERKASQE